MLPGFSRVHSHQPGPGSSGRSQASNASPGRLLPNGVVEKIFVIDDEPTIAKAIEHSVAEHEVITITQSAEEGLKRIGDRGSGSTSSSAIS